MSTVRAIGRRALSLALLLAIVSFLTYLALSASIAGPPFSLAETLRGYGSYVSMLAHGNLGETNIGEPVGQMILRTFFKSFGVLALAMGLAAVVGVGLALFGHSRTGGRRGLWPLAASIALLSLPSFVIGALFQLLGARLATGAGINLLPTIGFGWDKHLILPVLVLAIKPSAYMARVTGQVLEETLRQEFVRTAYAKGLSPRMVLFRHGLRTAAPGVLASLGLAMRASIGALPIVELVFVYPGMGFVFLDALRKHDTIAATGLALTLALTLWVLHFAVEQARRRLDPRLRLLTRAERWATW